MLLLLLFIPSGLYDVATLAALLITSIRNNASIVLAVTI